MSNIAPYYSASPPPLDNDNDDDDDFGDFSSAPKATSVDAAIEDKESSGASGVDDYFFRPISPTEQWTRDGFPASDLPPQDPCAQSTSPAEGNAKGNATGMTREDMGNDDESSSEFQWSEETHEETALPSGVKSTELPVEGCSENSSNSIQAEGPELTVNSDSAHSGMVEQSECSVTNNDIQEGSEQDDAIVPDVSSDPVSECCEKDSESTMIVDKSILNDFILETSNQISEDIEVKDTKLDAEEKTAETFCDFESFQSDVEEPAVQDQQLNSAASEVTTDDQTSASDLHEKFVTDATDDKSSVSDFEDFQTAVEPPANNVSERTAEKCDEENLQPQALVNSRQEETTLDDARGFDSDVEKDDFDDFEEFQIVSNEVQNPDSVHDSSNTDTAPVKVEADEDDSSWAAFNSELPSNETNKDDSWAVFTTASSTADATHISSDPADTIKKETTTVIAAQEEKVQTQTDSQKDITNRTTAEEEAFQTPKNKMDLILSRVVANVYPLVETRESLQSFGLLGDVICQSEEENRSVNDIRASSSGSFRSSDTGETKSNSNDILVWNNLKTMDLTSAFSFQWHSSAISQNLLQAINVDTSSILVGHKKPQAPLFAPNLGLLEPVKAPNELQILDKDPLTFLTSESSNGSSSAVYSAFTPQDMPQFEFDWGGSGLTNPLDATEKERELLDALEPTAKAPSPPLSLENMLAALSIPSTQFTAKSQKDVDRRKQLSEEAIRVLSTLPDLSFMQATVLMFPLKETVSS